MPVNGGGLRPQSLSLPSDLIINITSIKGLDPIGDIIVSQSF